MLTKTQHIWYSEGVNRTLRLRLDPTPEQAQMLAETSHQFTTAFNLVCRAGWDQGERNGVKLHHLTYRDSKDAAPGLVSDLHIQARVKATEAVKSALTRARQGRKAGCPTSTACPPRYNLHTYNLDWTGATVRLSTAGGRQTVPFRVPVYNAGYAGYPSATADLIHRRGRWYLHVVVSVPAPDVERTDVVVGCDLGLTRPAVTSDNRFHGERRWRELEARTFRLRRTLQKKGTKSAKRHLRTLSGKTARRRRDHDHVLSRRIVDRLTPGSTLAIENLTDIRSRVQARKANGGQRRLHSWSFANLQGFLRYKAEQRGIGVEAVDPRHTSQTCCACGFQSRYNRRSQSEFHCRSCGFQLNADLNGSRNIAAKLLAGRAIRATGGPTSIGLPCPPVNGTGEEQASAFMRG
jgi:putative transposase